MGTAGTSEDAFKKLAEAISAEANVVLFETTETWVTATIDGDWMYACRLVPQDGTHVIGELRVFPKSNIDDGKFENLFGHRIDEPLDFDPTIPRGGLTARQLRRIKLHPAVAASNFEATLQALWEGRSELSRLASFDVRTATVSGPLGTRVQERGRLNTVRRLLRGLRRRRRTDREYAHIASAYVDSRSVDSRKPIQLTAERLRMEPSQVRDAIHEARARELLNKSDGQGVSGGTLTAKAYRLLRGDSTDVPASR